MCNFRSLFVAFSFVLLYGCSTDYQAKVPTIRNSGSLVLDGPRQYLGDQIASLDPDYMSRANTFVNSTGCLAGDCINQVASIVDTEEGFEYHSILWGYATQLGIGPGEVPGQNTFREPIYLAPIVSAGSVFNIRGYLYFELINGEVVNAFVYRSDKELNFSAISLFRAFFVKKMLLSSSGNIQYANDVLFIGELQSTQEGEVEIRGCEPIFGTTRVEIYTAQMTGFGDQIFFGDPSDNEFYFSNGVTFDYFSTGEYSTQTLVIGNNCDTDFNPENPFITNTVFDNGGLITSTSSGPNPPCITAQTVYSPGSTEGAVVLSNWSFSIPGITDAFGNSQSIEFEMQVLVQVGHLLPVLFPSQREATVEAMNISLSSAQTEAYDYIFSNFLNQYRPNLVQTQNLSGDQLVQSVKSAVLRSLRNSYITNMLMLDQTVDGDKLNLEEFNPPYDFGYGGTSLANCVFRRP